MAEATKPTGLALLRVPFEPRHISKLPKQAGWMAEKKNEYKSCDVCGGWHHPKAVHLDYVGHAALTDRLLDCDPEWNWEPLAIGENGAPQLDQNGGMWIRLTVCGVTRMGYGHPDGKKGGDAIKEVIGDALRNAAMRFGAALDLWHKGNLHGDGPHEGEPKTEPREGAGATAPTNGRKSAAQAKRDGDNETVRAMIESCETAEELAVKWSVIENDWLPVLPAAWSDHIADFYLTKHEQLKEKEAA